MPRSDEDLDYDPVGERQRKRQTKRRRQTWIIIGSSVGGMGLLLLAGIVMFLVLPAVRSVTAPDWTYDEMRAHLAKKDANLDWKMIPASRGVILAPDDRYENVKGLCTDGASGESFAIQHLGVIHIEKYPTDEDASQVAGKHPDNAIAWGRWTFECRNRKVLDRIKSALR